MEQPISAMPPTSVNWLDRLAQAAILIAAAALVGMVLVQAWQVVGRYVLNDSPGWTEPMAVLLLDTAMSFGAAAAVHGNSHFGFPLLLDAMPAALQRICTWLGCLVIAGVGAVLTFWGGELLLDGLDVPMAGTALPQSATFLPMTAGGALMVVFALARLRTGPAIAVEPETY